MYRDIFTIFVKSNETEIISKIYLKCSIIVILHDHGIKSNSVDLSLWIQFIIHCEIYILYELLYSAQTLDT